MERIGNDIKSLLQVATPDEMDGLQDKLQRYLPESAVIHEALLARKVFKGIPMVFKTKFYQRSNSSLVVATPIISQNGIQNMTIFWDTNAEDDAEIVRLLLTIPEIDWTQSIFFYATPLIVLEKIQNMVEQGVIGEGLLRPHILERCHLYSIRAKTSNEQILPEGFELRPLTDEHVEFVFSQWEFNFTETIEAYKDLLRVVPAMGIFKRYQNDRNSTAPGKLNEDLCANGGVDSHQPITNTKSTNTQRNTNNENNPVAWTHLSQCNTLTNTFTATQHRGRKFATIVTNATVKRTLQKTGVVSVFITDDNLISIKMHENIGFVKQHALGYQYFKSLKSDSVLDEGTPFS